MLLTCKGPELLLNEVNPSQSSSAVPSSLLYIRKWSQDRLFQKCTVELSRLRHRRLRLYPHQKNQMVLEWIICPRKQPVQFGHAFIFKIQNKISYPNSLLGIGSWLNYLPVCDWELFGRQLAVLCWRYTKYPANKLIIKFQYLCLYPDIV